MVTGPCDPGNMAAKRVSDWIVRCIRGIFMLFYKRITCFFYEIPSYQPVSTFKTWQANKIGALAGKGSHIPFHNVYEGELKFFNRNYGHFRSIGCSFEWGLK